MCGILWNDVLQKTDLVNESLQLPGIEIFTVVELHESLLINFQNMRGEFEYYEEKTKLV